MSKSKSSTRQRLARAGFAAGAATTMVAALTSAPAYAAAGTLSLSSAGGVSGGGNTIVATLASAPTSPNPTTFTSSTAAYFAVATSATAAPTCPVTYPASPTTNSTASSSPAVKLLAPNKIAVVVPSGVVTQSSGTIYKYAFCTYASATSGASLIAGSTYSVGAMPRIAAVNSVTPVSGPALGGTTITVRGTGFVANTAASPNNTTATIDGQPLTNIVVVADGTSFSATTPPHAPGTAPLLLSVTTPGGTANTLGTTTSKATVFSYSNGIVVSPNTAANYQGSVDLDVQGVGFSQYTFDTTSGNTPNSTTAHVYLVAGSYNSTDLGGGSAGAKNKPETTECINVLVIGDAELLCSLPLNHTYDNATSGSPAIVTTGMTAARTVHLTTTASSATVTSSDAAFTQADVGLPIDDTNNHTAVAAGTIITGVSSPTTATMSANAAAAATNIATGAVGGSRTLPTVAAAVANGVTTLTGTAASGSTPGTFSSADVGRVFTSTLVATDPILAANTTITAVSANGQTATLSSPILAGATNPVPSSITDGVVTQGVPVTNGTYTITVVNSGNMQPVANISKSIISSGATFTVADY